MASQNGNSALHQTSRGLPSLARRLNQKLSIAGKQMCVAGDLNHPLGNHLLVNKEWSQKDRDSFETNGYISLDTTLGRHWANDTIPNAVVLRFIQGHARPANSSKKDYAHEISGSFLSPLCQGQKQVLWIISTTTPETASSDADTFYIVPSGFTAASDLERRPKSVDPVSTYMFPSAHAIPGVVRQPLRQGSTLFSDETFDPLNHVVHIDQFPELFAELFDTASALEMSIPAASAAASASASRNPAFRKEDYLTSHREFHQASWDFGLSFREY